MADKKIVDDYYSQNVQGQSETQDNDKKSKIKGKLKIKKEDSGKEESFVESTKSEEHVKKEVVKVTHKTEEQPEKKGSFTTQKGGYTTQRGREQQENGFKKEQNFQKNNFKDNQKSNFRDNQNQKPFERKDNQNQKSGENFNKSFKEFPKKTEGENKTENKESNFSFKKDYQQPNFKQDFVAGKKKTKKEGGEDERKSKFFKKDKNSKYSRNLFVEEDDNLTFSRSNKIKLQKKEEKNVEDIKQNLVNHTGETIIVSEVSSLKEFSEKIGVPIPKLIAEFMKNGMKVTLNSKIDYETASIIADAFEIKLQKDISSGLSVEDLLSGNIQSLLVEEDSSKLVSRPPVISIMGHVDHGKTSLLDYIRKTKVADKEAGGITQSIGAYQVEYNSKKITFLDTPGHEAFTIMRARGAKSTDIAILVVAADEGVKPQTIESINHAREANIQIIVAITKIDKPGANLDNVKSGLSQYGLLSEDWGGDISMVGVSAKSGEGVDELLELILLASEMLELKANPDRNAVGTVLESHLDIKLGPVSSVLINTGELNKGDCIVCKGSYGRVKILKDHLGKNVSKATLSQPVLLVGLDSVLEGGDIVQVVSDIDKARIKALEYNELISSKKALSSSSIDLIMSKIKSGSLKQLKVVLKADTNGSLEAIKGALLKLSTEETKVTIIHSGVGNITEGDVLMCQGSSAILIGFNVDLLGTSRNLIEDKKIEYIASKIIYHITERVEKIVTGMLDPKEVEVNLGNAQIGGIFYEGEGFTIVGLKLLKESKIIKNAQVRIVKSGKIVGKGVVENLKSGIIDVTDIEGPTECGIKLKTDVKVQLGDELEIFKVEIQK